MLVIMSVYTMDYGLIFYSKLELQNAAQAGVQWAIANRVYNSSDIRTAATYATRLQPDKFNVTSSQFCGCSEDSGGNPIVTQLSVGSCTASSTCTSGVAGTYVSVSATFTAASGLNNNLITYGLVPRSYSLTASSTARLQ